MKYVVGLCCLLFAARAFASNLYFDNYVKVKAGDEETGAKVLSVHKGKVFELTIIPDGEEEEPIVISVSMKETEDENVAAIYSVDGKHRIGTGTASLDDDDNVNLKLEFVLLCKGTKVADVKIAKQFSKKRGLPAIHINFQLVGALELSFEDDLQFDLAKTMRCSEGDSPASDC